MKKYFVCIIILHLLNSYVAVGQEKEDNIGFNQYSSSLFNSKENTLNVISGNGPTSFSQGNTALQDGILIQQVGDFNVFQAVLKSPNTNVTVAQKGNDNEVILDKEAASINQRIVQEGNGNFLTDISTYTPEAINIDFIQQGDNQTIQSYGTNSISKDMTVRQSGNGASVIIINR